MRCIPFVFPNKAISITCILLFVLNCFAVCQGINGESDSTLAFQKINDRGNRLTTIKYGGDTLIFQPTPLWQKVKKVPADLLYIAKSPFKKKNLPWVAAVTVSSAVFITYDQKITDWIKQTSHLFGVSANTSYNVLIKVGDTKVLQVPKNGTTAFYQLGQGGTSLVLAGGMWAYGKLYHDYRALSTASDLSETFITMAIVTQAIKRITGRESPFESTAPGGRWRPFPSFSKFQKDTPKYDAFPSGHLATLMATITVLSDNYPEKKWIKPVGYSLMGICMWTMANIEVHWVGDYPLALAIGYLSGKITALRHKKKPELKQAFF